MTPRHNIKYLGTFLAASGIYANVPQILAWNGNNIGGSTKRSVGIAMQVGFGNLGGIISGYMYVAKEGPWYYRGHGTCMGLLMMSTVFAIGLSWWCRQENMRRCEADFSSGKVEGWKKEDMEAEKDKGDDAGFFRYTI